MNMHRFDSATYLVLAAAAPAVQRRRQLHDAGHGSCLSLAIQPFLAREHDLHSSKLLRLISGVSSQLSSEKGSQRARRHTSRGTMDSNGGMVVEDQGVLIEQALGSVRAHTNHMRRCLENPSKLLDAVKAAYVLGRIWE